MTDTLVITAADIAKLIADRGVDYLMDEMIERLERALQAVEESRFEAPPRRGFHYEEPHPGLIEWMPGIEPGVAATIKIVGYHPENPRFGDPTILSTVSAYDPSNGHLIGLADATFLTALRTGAASGVASRILARPESTTVGLVGLGAQAVSQLHALLRIFPIERVLVMDVDPDRAASFPQRTGELIDDRVEINEAPLSELLSDADIVCTSTSLPVGGGPLFEDGDFKPWLHVNAVGSDFPGKFELPVGLLERALVCPDVTEQAVLEGECQQLDPGAVGPSLAVLARKPRAYVAEQERLTVFDSTGWALFDHVGMAMIMEMAEDQGVGQRLAVEAAGGDPYSPYHWPTGQGIQS